VALSLSELNRLKRKSYWSGVGILLFDVGIYALAITGTICAPHLRQRFGCAVIAGFWTSALLIVAHDACHQSLTASRWLNRVIGTIAFLPALHSYSLWHYGHNLVHHLFTNQRRKDYAWEPLSLREYQSLGRWSRWRYRFFRTFFGHLFYYICEIWWPRYFFPRRRYLNRMEARYWMDFLFIAAWLVSICTFAIVARCSVWQLSIDDPMNWLEPLLLTVTIPFLVSEMLLSSSVFFNHCHPHVHWYTTPPSGNWTERQIHSSIHVQFPWIIDWLMHWIMDHTAHHIQPTIASYQLLETQQLIESQYQEEVVSYRWSIRAMRAILRDCKLYDDEAGCWTDYSGRPTSESRRRLEMRSDRFAEPGDESAWLNKAA
jgi:omega-6 fatty acid desaturase (delta-12 desaturase)